MKKIIILLTIVTTFLINISCAYALNISIDDIKVLDKNSTIGASNITSSELTIIPTITFNNTNDYITYKITFKGENLANYKVSTITDNNKNEYIKTSYKYNETLSEPIYMTLLYKEPSKENTTLDDIKINITFVGNDNEETVVIDRNPNKNTEEKQVVPSNPQTGLLSHIMIPLVLIIVTIFLIKHYTKFDENNNLMILILFIILLPLTIYAEVKETLTITFDASNIIIKSIAENNVETPTKYYVYLYPNGGTGITEGQKFEYTGTTKFSSFPKVTKENCTLDGWNLDSPTGKEYYTDIEETDNGKKLYARWNCKNINLDIKVTSGAKTVLNQPIDSFLKGRGDSLSAYNAYIKSMVTKAGMGTREGVVAAAVSSINYLYDNHNTKMPYYWGGHYQTIGIPQSFGTNSPSTPSPSGTRYQYISFDCSGFVNWAIKNGGYNFADTNSYDTKYPHCNIANVSCTGQPGDLIESAAHVVMIVSVDTVNHKYYVAESTTSGVIVQTRGFHENLGGLASTIVNMETYYSNSTNKASY